MKISILTIFIVMLVALIFLETSSLYRKKAPIISQNVQAAEKKAEAESASEKKLVEVNKREDYFEENEIVILERLAQRRKNLEKLEFQLEERKKILVLTEREIDKKLTELKKLEKSVSSLLEKYNQKVDEKINSLVKIYESMKPAEAAAILSEMEIETLMKVVTLMKEKKLAAILSKMNPELAKALTEEYASYRSLE